MKMSKNIIIIVVATFLLAGCAKVNETVEYMDIHTEAELVFDGFPYEEGDICRLLGMQFYQDEPVQIWGVVRLENGIWCGKIYLYREDGTCGLLMDNAPREKLTDSWYIDRDGGCYCMVTGSGGAMGALNHDDRSNFTIIKYDSQGNEVYNTWIGAFVRSFCQMPDGRIYLLLEREEELALAELDAAGGGVSEVDFDIRSDGTYHMGTGMEGLFIQDNSFVDAEWLEVNLEEKSMSSVLSSQGTSYSPGAGGINVSGMLLYDFRVLGDGGIEILWGDIEGDEGVLEKLQVVKVEKTPIIMRGLVYSDPWLKKSVAQFNQMNGDYQIVLEECGYDLDWNDDTRQDLWENYAKMTSVEIAGGKGPDILYGGVLSNYITGIMEKGGLVDLIPYMEEYGIREEDYFPLAFNTWRDGDKLYGIKLVADIDGYVMYDDVMDGYGEMGIEALLDALLAREVQAVYMTGYDSQDLLELFLQGTDSIWGMVDWEDGVCGFGGELFAKLLEAAKRYGDDGRNNYPALAAYRRFTDVFGFYPALEMEEAGWEAAGVLFDDGCHAATASAYTIAINANSDKKEGAWEFISYLMSVEAQSARLDSGYLALYAPVNRDAYSAWVEAQRKWIADWGKVLQGRFKWKDGESVYETVEYGEEDFTEERIEEYRQILEDARPLPLRTRPILEIIYEEAAYYFDGAKSIEEVAGVVENRVQLYLDEIRGE